MKFALIGNGNVAHYYIQTFLDFSAEFVICSRTEQKGFAYPHVTDFMSPDILSADYVCVATPPYLHYEMANYYLNKGKNVILEKPAVITLAELKMLVGRTKSKNLYLAYHSAFNPLIQTFISSFQVKDLNKVEVNYAEDVFFYHPNKSSWLFRKSLSGGGCLADSGINIFSILYQFLPEMELVSGKLSKKQFEVEDAIDLSMITAGGIPIKIKMDWLADIEKREFKLWAAEDKLTFDLATNNISLNGSQITLFNKEINRVDQYSEYKNMLNDAINYFKNGTTQIKYSPMLPLKTVLTIYGKLMSKTNPK